MAKTNETKRIPAIKADISPEQGLLNLTFSTGKQLNLHASKLTEEIRQFAMLHGLKQKLVDAAAISRNPETGRSATVGDKLAAVEKVYDRLVAGLWNEPREGGGSGSYLLRALCKLYPAKAAEDVKTWLDGMDDAKKKALELNPRVAEAILAIKAEKLGADDVDTDELLGELDEEDDAA